jgi:hypothetical protein
MIISHSLTFDWVIITVYNKEWAHERELTDSWKGSKS